jgi:hypothetical protein
MNTKPVPEENLKTYKILYCVEVGIREFIIENLESRGGTNCWKQRLPPDVLKTFRDGIKYERRIKWSNLVPHHPLYYVEFPDLKKIIERADNWRNVFDTVLKSKDVFISTLTELEPIRSRGQV